MSYKKRYEIEHMKDIRKAKIIKTMIRWGLFLTFLGALLGVMIGVSALDGKTEIAAGVMVTSMIVLCGSGWVIDKLEDSEWF